MSNGDKMKPLSYLLVLLVLSMTSLPSALADHPKTVTVTNNTTYTMSEFYASSSDSSAWDTGNNLMTGQTVGPGQATTITIADGLSVCNYDLMAVLYGATQHAYQYRINACDGGAWTVHQ
jgi:hypothetical protein